MDQAAFPFAIPVTGRAATGATGAAGALQRAAAPARRPAADADLRAFEIGWDHAHHRLTPPLAHLHADNPVRQGWSAGRSAFGARTLRPTVAVRQWLALRLQAWQEGQPFEEVQVTPNFLSRIDQPICPVSRLPLQSGQAADHGGEPVVQRLCTAAAYAAGNLAVVSRTVAEARAGMDWQQALAHVRRIDAGECSGVRGLGAAQWHRLAVLASFATPIAHGLAACLPLRVLPPNRVRAINPVQALQVMLTLQFTQAGYARRLLALAALMPGSEPRQAFQIFMHTLLARRLAAGTPADPLAMRQAMEDSWADPLVNRRWQRLALRLDAADCERLLQRAGQRQLAVGGSRWLSDAAATDGWELPGRADGAAGQAALPAGRAVSARSSGSQKLAS